MLFPIGVYKSRGDDVENNSELIYFTHSLLDTVSRLHERDDFIMQRYVIGKGLCPSLVRCDVEI